MNWAKTGSIKMDMTGTAIGPLTLIVAAILIVIIMLLAAPNLLSVEFQWLMAAGLIVILSVWMQNNRKPTARPA